MSRGTSIGLCYDIRYQTGHGILEALFLDFNPVGGSNPTGVNLSHFASFLVVSVLSSLTADVILTCIFLISRIEMTISLPSALNDESEIQSLFPLCIVLARPVYTPQEVEVGHHFIHSCFGCSIFPFI